MPRAEPKLILVVEDDPSAREFLRNVLQSLGYSVIAVEDGLAALHYLEGSLPDAIVLDLDLPRLHGRDVHRELKAHGLTDRVPVIIVTGTNEVLPVNEFAFVLRKPVDADALYAAIERAIRIVRT